MKRYIFALIAGVATLVATAQSLPPTAPYGANKPIEDLHASTIIIDMPLTITHFTAGVYARYAQRLLGERAALTDKTSATIGNSTIALAWEGCYLAPSSVDMEAEVVETDQSLSIPIDRMSAELISLDQAAQEAASTLFNNRKICRDLISGDIGEGVFGAGLAVALQRFDLLEREYLKLFMGSEVSTTSTQRFVVNINPESTRYMLCRLDPQRGLSSLDDISGEAVYLQITPSEMQDSTLVIANSKIPRATYVAPNYARCDLYVGAEIVSTATLPLYDFGSRITITNGK